MWKIPYNSTKIKSNQIYVLLRSNTTIKLNETDENEIKWDWYQNETDVFETL